MSNDVLVIAEKVLDEYPDVTYELLGKAKEIASASSGQVHVLIMGEPGNLESLGAADLIHVVESGSPGTYSSEVWEAGSMELMEEISPKLTLLSTGTIGLDLVSSLGVKMDAHVASYVIKLWSEDGKVVVTSQIYGGKLLADAELEGTSIVAVIPGSFPSEAGRASGSPKVATRSLKNPPSLVVGEAIVEPEKSGVDIVAADMLVSVGRGIGGEANIEMVQELADALKVPLSASRPIIDQGWLPKPHQVGKSGKKVKPKVYLALGISGAPEHLEGIANAETVIACNTDPKAPIFEAAQYGTTIDLFDLIPELLDRIG